MSAHTATETYRGQEIRVQAYEERRGVWTWTYVVGDQSGRSAVRATCPTAEAALRRALLAAKARIDDSG